MVHGPWSKVQGNGASRATKARGREARDSAQRRDAGRCAASVAGSYFEFLSRGVRAYHLNMYSGDPTAQLISIIPGSGSMGQWATGEWRSGVTLRRAEGARGAGAAPIKAMAPCGTELPTTILRRSCVALRRRSESDRAHLLELIRLEVTRSERRIRTPVDS